MYFCNRKLFYITIIVHFKNKLNENEDAEK